MTYCVAIKLNAGLKSLSDSWINTGLGQISTYRVRKNARAQALRADW